jgi:hypothetical protein
VAAAAGLLAGAYADRVARIGTHARDVVLGVAAAGAGVTAAIGIGLLTADVRPTGLGFLAAVVVYAALAAAIFRRPGCRNASTVLWSIAILFLVAAEALLVTDSVWRSVVITTTALALGAVAEPLRELRLWLAGASLLVSTSLVVLLIQVQPWRDDGQIDRSTAIASASVALAAFALAAFAWGDLRRRELTTVVWGTGLVALLATERVLLDDWRTTALAVALTGGGVALLARPLEEARLWAAGAVVTGWATIATLTELTPPSHLLRASDAAGAGVWVLAGCVVALVLTAISIPAEDTPGVPFLEGLRDSVRRGLVALAGGIALYGVSLVVLELAVRVSGASVETDFERGHTAVSGIWALVGLTLLVIGLLRGSAPIRYGGLALFGLSLAKIFLYDLAELSSVARAFSFILVGGLLLAGGFFLQRLSDRIGPKSAEPTI